MEILFIFFLREWNIFHRLYVLFICFAYPYRHKGEERKEYDQRGKGINAHTRDGL